MDAMPKTHTKAGSQPKDDGSDGVHEAALEKGEVVASTEDHLVEEPEKAYHSKQSVWLMILFSGLAIGSDGYNGKRFTA